MARARTLTLNTNVNVTGADKLQGLGKQLQRTGAALSLFVTAPLVALGAAATEVASDLNESMNAVKVVFGEAAGEIDKFGRTSAKTVGLSQRAFNQAATQFSAFAKTVAGDGGDVAGVIETITKRGADFASVYNIDVADAMRLFQSGLAGETEPLRKFGVDLSAAAVEAHALAKGIGDGIGPLTEAEKIQARYSLLLEATAQVQGDFANTSMEAANAQRIAAAAAEDAAAKLGQKFIPIKLKVIEVLSAAIDAWSKLPAPIQDSIVVFGLAAAALGPLLGLIGTLVRSFGFLIKILPGATVLMQKFSLATSGVLGPIGLLVGALGAAAIAYSDFINKTDPTSAAFLRLGNEAGVAVHQISGAAVAIARDLGISVEEVKERVVEAAEAMGLSWEEAIDLVSKGTDRLTVKHKAAVVESGKQWDLYQAQITNAMTGPDGAVPTIEDAVDAMAQEMGEAPGKMADELLANQQKLADATTELVNFMEQALSPAEEIFRLEGFLSSAELAAGLADGNPLVVQKATELRDAAAARLDELRGMTYQVGASAGYAFGAGLVDPAVINFVAGSASRLAAAARGIFPSSEPKDPNSPLRGITKAFGFGEILAQGILSGQSAVTNAMRGLVSGGVTMPAVGAGAGAGGVGGGTIINNFYLQWKGEPPTGRTEQEIISTLQRLLPMLSGQLTGI